VTWSTAVRVPTTSTARRTLSFATRAVATRFRRAFARLGVGGVGRPQPAAPAARKDEETGINESRSIGNLTLLPGADDGRPTAFCLLPTAYG
jgi:hypothetical protein